VTLADVKVGDKVVIVDVNRPPKRVPVTAVGRKYLTAGKQDFSRETGGWRDRQYAHHRRAYTIEQWAHEEASEALWAAIRRLGQCRKFGALTTDEIRDMTATLEGVAKKLEAT
jgi:hypothetical protein